MRSRRSIAITPPNATRAVSIALSSRRGDSAHPALRTISPNLAPLESRDAHARAIAQDLHKAHPHDAASPHAFALFNPVSESALKIMRQLTPEQVHDPSVAAYFGVLLAAAGQNDDATEYFALAEKAKLLPEEEELVAQAKASLARQ